MNIIRFISLVCRLVPFLMDLGDQLRLQHTAYWLVTLALSRGTILLTERTSHRTDRKNAKIHFIFFGPRQANLVLIAYASSEGSSEPAHLHSLARTFAARSYKQWVKKKLQTSLNGWACAVKPCHDGMLEDTNSLDGAHFILWFYHFYLLNKTKNYQCFKTLKTLKAKFS